MGQSHDAAIQDLRKEFFRVPGVCLAVLAAIHILPKAREGEIFRFALMLVYFAALFRLLWHFTKPLETYLGQLFAWRFEDSGPALEMQWKRYLYSIKKVACLFAYLGM